MARKQRGRNEGSVFQRADGRWCGAVSLGFRIDQHGRKFRRRKYIYGATKADVLENLKALPSEPREIRTTEISVSGLLDAWLGAESPRLADNTVERYRKINIALVEALGVGKRARKLSANDVRALLQKLAQLGLSSRSRQMMVTQLGTALRYGLAEGHVSKNVVKGIATPKGDTEFSVWSQAEVDAFLTAAQGHRLYALFVLAVVLGPRQGEMLALTWRDVDLEAGTIQIRRSLQEMSGKGIAHKVKVKPPKTKAGVRRLPLPAIVRAALVEHRAKAEQIGQAAPDTPVFCSSAGTYMRKGNLFRVFLSLVEKARVPRIRPHDLRHTAATRMLSQGIDVKTVSHVLGHADPAVTLRTYSHVLPSMTADAVQKLDVAFGHLAHSVPALQQEPQSDVD